MGPSRQTASTRSRRARSFDVMSEWVDAAHLAVELGRAWAAGDFAAARRCLADDCVYERSGGALRGADAVIADLVARAARVQRACDDVRCDIAMESFKAREARIVLTEYLIKVPGHAHRHVRRLEVRAGHDGRIERIVERTPADDDASLARFLAAP